MTSFSQIVFEPGGVALSIFALLTLFGQIYAVISSFSQERNILLRLTMVLQFVLGLCWFCLLLDGSFTVGYFDRQRAYFGLTRLIFDAPWIAVAVIELIFAVILLLSLMILRRYGRRHLSGGAIKETVDMLPVGICFAKEDGTVVLKNLLADSICRELTGSALTDLDRFWKHIEATGEKQNQVSIVILPSGKAVMLQRCEIEVDSERFFQMIACDISEQYRMTAELRDKNHKLLDIQQRMKAFGEMSQRLAMTEEILRARVSIHDEMFLSLLMVFSVFSCLNISAAENGNAEVGANYNLWLGSTRVTDANKNDILGDGTASFDSNTNTLRLNDPTISGFYYDSKVVCGRDQYGNPVYLRCKIYASDISLNVIGYYHMSDKNMNQHCYGLFVKNGCASSERDQHQSAELET